MCITNNVAKFHDIENGEKTETVRLELNFGASQSV